VAERLGVPHDRLLESMRWLDSSGAVYSGAEAWNAAWSAALGTRLPLLIYRIPGMRFVQTAIYRWVADHRYRFLAKRRTASRIPLPADARNVLCARPIS
jgi:predicted DCC family thiol-disulfide oxidoreductase YuxK